MSENAGENRFSVPTGLDGSRQVPTGAILETAAWELSGVIGTKTEGAKEAIGSYRDLPSVACLGSKFIGVEKLLSFTQLWSGGR